MLLPGEPPQEVQDEIARRRKEQADMHMMAHEESVAATNRLIDGLGMDELKTLHRMLNTTIGDDNDTYAMHTTGWINSVLHYKFGVCLACGEKHDDIPLTEEKEPADD